MERGTFISDTSVLSSWAFIGELGLFCAEIASWRTEGNPLFQMPSDGRPPGACLLLTQALYLHHRNR